MKYAFLSVLVAISLAGWMGTGQANSPEMLAERTAELARKGDWDGYAKMMHPEALSALKTLFRPIVAADEKGQVSRRIFGVESVSQYDSMTTADVFTSMMRNLTKNLPGFAEALRTSDMSVIGSVPEGNDLVHVVYRFGANAEGVTVSKTGVITFQRYREEWRALLSGNIEGLAARLRQMSNRKPAP